MEKPLHEPVMVQRPVEPNREPVAYRSVPDIEARVASPGEDIIMAAVGFGGVGDLLVDEMGVEEGDGEPGGGELGG